jgi:hypothetical protein
MLRFFKQLYPGRREVVTTQLIKYRRGVERMESLRSEMIRLQASDCSRGCCKYTVCLVKCIERDGGDGLAGILFFLSFF